MFIKRSRYDQLVADLDARDKAAERFKKETSDLRNTIAALRNEARVVRKEHESDRAECARLGAELRVKENRIAELERQLQAMPARGQGGKFTKKNRTNKQ